MRIATTIISLCLMLIVGLQSCAVAFGGTLTSDESLSGGGAIGMFVAFLFLLGGAFAISFPIVSLSAFVFSAVLALAVGVGSDFSDMSVWAFVALALATMSFFGMREKKRKAAESQARVK
jgi:4-amino-4-deoxy-L-arabinose transferase-like glycosyltransferase